MTGSRIEIIAPSGALLSPECYTRALDFLRARGHVLHGPPPLQAWQRFSAPDDERLAQIEGAAGRRDIDAVMITRGGYGLSRLLDRIDWDRVAASVEAGVRWIGYSDFTAFQLALLARTGAVSFAGPAVAGDFGADTPDSLLLASFDALLDGRLLPVRWPRNSSAVSMPGATAPESAGNTPIDGILWGGNLSLVAAAVGTPYLPQPDAGILFLEDVGEHPYRVERMLYQLFHAGVLAAQRAIVLGHFTGWEAAAHDDGYDLSAVVGHFRQRLSVPIVTGLPFGHVPRKAVLGIGVRYRLERDGADWLLTPDRLDRRATAHQRSRS